MTGLDTNVIVRFLMKDDADQAELANAVFAKLTSDAPGFVCREVLVELVWVLQKIYRLPRTDIADAIEGLLGAREIVVEAGDQVAVAVDRLRKGGAGFADQMIALAGQGAGCRATVTFDRKAAGFPGMSLLGAVSDH
ncbi:MAG: type II toxin-antitoxin system VapC family toxin [Rhodobacteraceae bacterium]|nr:type II toxin-antitoxin system VapC family toxin [Paracoccaceae bacterium]